MAFVQSKYYVDFLSENTKRGLRQKVRNGDYPSQAPVGYINDSRTKSIVVDKKKSRVIRLAFKKYAKGESRLEDVSNFLAKTESFQGVERESPKRERLLFFQIHFTSGYPNMAVNATEENMSPLFQRNCLIRRKKF